MSEPASQPVAPVAPKTLLSTLVAAIGGCALATATVLLIEHFADTLRTAEDIQQSLGLPTLAAIPRPSRRQERDKTPIALAHPTSSMAAAYRSLHARLQSCNGNSRWNGKGMLNTMLVTSPVSKREKANLALNLGVVMAQAGLQVLLVDADLRQPELHQAFGLTNEVGLSTLLSGNGNCQECISRTDIRNLCVLLSGPPPEPPALSRQQIPHVFEELRMRADVVLFDAPPVLSGTDAMLLASQAEGTVLAIECGFTRREVAIQATERLRGVQAKMMGVVLN